jgi:hypothetical protein
MSYQTTSGAAAAEIASARFPTRRPGRTGRHRSQYSSLADKTCQYQTSLFLGAVKLTCSV